jgi:hypothetical protein
LLTDRSRLCCEGAANMYRVKMQNRLRYTLAAVLFVVAIGSVLIAVEQRAFDW